MSSLAALPFLVVGWNVLVSDGGLQVCGAQLLAIGAARMLTKCRLLDLS